MNAPLLVLDGVKKRFPGGHVALAGVSLSVAAGEFVVLLGRSGAGKSTILRAITGLVSPSAGTLSFDGAPLLAKTLPQARRRIATIHQQFNLVGRASVAANILSGAIATQPFWRVVLGWHRAALRRRAWALLQRVGLGEEHLLRRAADLSGGQQQRVGIARALVLDPVLILADEPVASLDPKVSRDVLQLLRGAAAERGAAVLCSLHQIDLAHDFADRIIGIADGRVCFDGPPAALTPAIIERLYGTSPAMPILEAAAS